MKLVPKLFRGVGKTLHILEKETKILLEVLININRIKQIQNESNNEKEKPKGNCWLLLFLYGISIFTLFEKKFMNSEEKIFIIYCIKWF